MNRTKPKHSFLIVLLINIAIIGIVLFAFFSLGKYEIITVDTLALNVRTGPGVSYDIQAQVKKGENLTILKKQNQWYNVRLDDHSTGWVASWLVTKQSSSATTNVQASVNTQNTKLREQNNTDSEILATLEKGTNVTVTMEQNGWTQVTYKNKTGYINSSLLDVSTDDSDKSETKETLYARQDDTKIREKPSISSDIVDTLSYGESVTYSETSNDWYKVTTSSGKTGYIANWVVSFDALDKKNKKSNSSIAETTIVLDPGHGGDDPGAESNDGTLFEKNVTLPTALAVKKKLEALGANVIMTRSKDTLVSLANIAQISNDANADAFISFHFDSSEQANEASGTTTYYYAKKNKSLAKAINTYLDSDLPLENRGYEFGDFQVLRDNNQPAVLLELGYINNDYDKNEIQTKNYRSKIADAVTKGLNDYFSEK